MTDFVNLALLEALKPFADMADAYGDDVKDGLVVRAIVVTRREDGDPPVAPGCERRLVITVGDLRKARDAWRAADSVARLSGDDQGVLSGLHVAQGDALDRMGQMMGVTRRSGMSPASLPAGVRAAGPMGPETDVELRARLMALVGFK
jgi:hypothetical protein